MKFKIEIDLDEEYLLVLRDVSRSTEEWIPPMRGAWRSRAEQMAKWNLLTIETRGIMERYALTEMGKHILAHIIFLDGDSPKEAGNH